jgi:hypothetical protein
MLQAALVIAAVIRGFTSVLGSQVYSMVSGERVSACPAVMALLAMGRHALNTVLRCAVMPCSHSVLLLCCCALGRRALITVLCCASLRCAAQITDVSKSESEEKAAVTKNTGLALAAAAVGVAIGPLVGGFLAGKGNRCVLSRVRGALRARARPSPPGVLCTPGLALVRARL